MKKKRITLILVLILLFLLSLRIGRYEISFIDIKNIVTDTEKNKIMSSIFLNIRLPRSIFAIISGSGLALSGFIYQSIFRNSLVSPDILGVSSGASVGAILGILFFSHSEIFIQTLAFGFGLLAVILALILGNLIGKRNNYSMIIAGIIIGAIGNSIIMLLKYVADPTRELVAIDYWLMGNLNIIEWVDVKRTGLMVGLGITALFILRYRLQILTLGDEEAETLGINVSQIKILGIIGATILASSIISTSGIISWIGLIVPHMVMMIFGTNFKENFIETIILGGIVLLAADILARSLFSAELPISILTSFIGGISLIIFISRKRLGGR